MSTTLQLTDADLRMIVGDIAQSTSKFVRESIEPLRAEIRDLQQRVEVLSARDYKGIWKAAEDYPRGASVTHRNGLWYARANSRGVRPGTSHDWQLASRAGTGGED